MRPNTFRHTDLSRYYAERLRTNHGRHLLGYLIWAIALGAMIGFMLVNPLHP